MLGPEGRGDRSNLPAARVSSPGRPCVEAVCTNTYPFTPIPLRRQLQRPVDRSTLVSTLKRKPLITPAPQFTSSPSPPSKCNNCSHVGVILFNFFSFFLFSFCIHVYYKSLIHYLCFCIPRSRVSKSISSRGGAHRYDQDLSRNVWLSD